jgi:hypothetical protein
MAKQFPTSRELTHQELASDECKFQKVEWGEDGRGPQGVDGVAQDVQKKKILQLLRSGASYIVETRNRAFRLIAPDDKPNSANQRT